MPDRFITMAEVSDRVALSRAHIHRLIRAGAFPQSIPLGTWKVVFLEREVDAWMKARVEARSDRGGRDDRAREAAGSRWDAA